MMNTGMAKFGMWRNRTTWLILAPALAAGLLLAGLLFAPAGERLRLLAADTLIATQHRHWAGYLIGSAKLQERVDWYNARFDEYAGIPTEPPVPTPALHRTGEDGTQGSFPAGVELIPVEGPGYKGYLLVVPDPAQVRVMVPEEPGRGETVSAMAERSEAVAGVNGGGFVDGGGEGSGYLPAGIVISDGRLLYTDLAEDEATHVVGLDWSGRMIAGKYTLSELRSLQVKEAVTFAPRFIVNGEGLIRSRADGWGIAPRTAMAQKADGTLLFAVIEGRHIGSLGATLYDLQELLLEHGAVIAANLDGGSSSVLVYGGERISRTSGADGERRLPTAWLVYEDAAAVQVPPVWGSPDGE